MQKPLPKQLVLFLVFMCSSIGYNFLYTYALQISFSWISFVYSTCISLTLWIALSFSQKKLWRSFLFVSSCFIILFGLVNVAYFSVFSSFLRAEAIVSASTFVSDTFIRDYISSVPFFLYIGSLILMGVYGWIFFFSNWTMVSTSHKKHLVATLVTVCFMQGLLVMGAGFFITNPKETWWSKRAEHAEVGFIGFLYKDVVGRFVSNANAKEEVRFQDGNDRYRHMRDTLKQIASLHTSVPKKEFQISSLEKPPHIIFYQLESIPAWVKQLSPNPLQTLTELAANNISVQHFIPNGCFTINAEFSTLCSAVSDSKPIGENGKENSYYCLPNILEENYGYKTKLYHANSSDFWYRNILAPKWGFQELFFTPTFSYRDTDHTVIDEVVDKMKESEQPTFNYIIGFTSHSPHNKEYIEHYQKQGVSVPEYTSDIPDHLVKEQELSETGVQEYLWFVSAVDNAVQHLFSRLREEKLDSNTIVVIYGDHRYYNFPRHSEENFYRFNEVPFFIATPNNVQGTVSQYASHIDIAPTVLNLLQGTEYTAPPHFVGTSLFSKEHPNNVLLRCNDMVNYVDPYVVLYGNSDTGVYTNVVVNSPAVDSYIPLVQSLVTQSNTFVSQDSLVPEYLKKSSD